MKLNHINLVVGDVADATNFFETYFDFKCTDRKGDDMVAVLKSPENFTLVIMKNKEDEPVYPNAFHIGFMLESEVMVTDKYQQLKTAGIISAPEPKKIRDSFGFYFTYQNIMFEIGYYY